MKNIWTKITAFILIAILITACNAIKKVPDGKFLLTKNEIIVNNKSIKDQSVFDQLYQKPNGTLLGVKLRLHLYNWANPNPDSTYQAKFTANPGKYERQSKLLSSKQVDRLGQSFYYRGIHDFLQNTGEAPVIIDSSKNKKSELRIKYHYFNKGYFDVKTKSKIDSVGIKKGKVEYTIFPGQAFVIDTVQTTISSPALDSLFKITKDLSLIKTGNQYKTEDFENEKERISTYFRNNGVFNFQPNYVTFDIDTLNNNKKANVNLIIGDYSYQENDSTKTQPFRIFRISEVNIYTDYSEENSKKLITDTVKYNNFNLLSYEKLKYKPRAITDGVFIIKGNLFADTRTVLTSRYLSNLRIFNYPSITYKVDSRNPNTPSLIANIHLKPRKKFSFGQTLSVTHSNIQDFGIGMSITESIRNVFNGAETLELSARGNIGSSKDLANPSDRFFNVTEYGIDLRLNIPRMFTPFNTEKIVPKRMIPSTAINIGISKQTNIGLDKENFTSAISYNWTPKKNNSTRFDLFNIQYVRNLNPENYFNVYSSSYDALNGIGQVYGDPKYLDTSNNLIIESGTKGFTNDVLTGNTALTTVDADYQTVESIEERRIRLSENNFILATNFSFSKTTKKDILDNDYYIFRTKIESAGTLLSAISTISNLDKNQNGNYEIFNLEYSEYAKTEFDFIKYWDLSKERVFAFRSFFGIAIPFGNANNVPFSRSYFSGGSNDNRAWEPYSLGPGSSGSKDDFNEANMKIALSAEYRFKIAGSLKGAIFADAGNIWNVLDNITFEKATFDGIKDLKEIALGTGFGLRYDFDFFIVRFDFGFKTHNPAEKIGERWFKDYNFGNSVLNFGINYPF